MTLTASKKITAELSVVADGNEIQVRIGDRIEYVWFCNNIEQARAMWLYAVSKARRMQEAR